jgi:hypothetical protein
MHSNSTASLPAALPRVPQCDQAWPPAGDCDPLPAQQLCSWWLPAAWHSQLPAPGLPASVSPPPGEHAPRPAAVLRCLLELCWPAAVAPDLAGACNAEWDRVPLNMRVPEDHAQRAMVMLAHGELARACTQRCMRPAVTGQTRLAMPDTRLHAAMHWSAAPARAASAECTSASAWDSWLSFCSKSSCISSVHSNGWVARPAVLFTSCVSSGYQ